MAHLRPEESHSSPYFLHPNENPSLMLVATPLNGQNYYASSRAMRMALISKNKIKFVDGSIIVPSVDDPLCPAWKRCNTMVLSRLVQSLAATISQSVISLDSAYEIWNDLKDRFSQKDHVRVSDLQQELYSLRQGSLSVTEYFTHLKILWDEFVSLRPMPVCSCAPKCSCDGYLKMKSYYDNDYTLRFIRGLNETYSNIKSQMFMLDPLPKINKVFGLVIQQERQSAVPLLPTPTETSVFYSNARAGPYKPNFNNSRSPSTFNSQRKFYPTKFNMNNNLLECAFFGASGHSIDRCFKKHGYPPGHPGFRPQGKQVISSANMAEGQYCTESYQNNSEFHNSDNDQYDMPSSYDETMQHNQQNMVNLSFTPDQYMKILALIQPSTAQNPSSQIHAPSSSQIHAPPNNNALQAQFDAANTAKISGITLYTSTVANVTTDQSLWFLDSGATDHIICSSTYYTSCAAISN
ncbi:uncharacterized protein LOC126661980 [Mercurialis annua]|uniref:uncharacterized protein LOC126661980 n=1 Tax=Mercurialis annua TaxID=3986 RepID=UPI00215EAA9B|nr:uncharacterized protein LOC126661980 [Mercurialis annua]